MTERDGLKCPACAGTGRIVTDASGGQDMRQLVASGEVSFVPKPEAVTMTREQYDHLLINGTALRR